MGGIRKFRTAPTGSPGIYKAKIQTRKSRIWSLQFEVYQHFESRITRPVWACNNDVKRMAGERVTRGVHGALAVAMINNAGPKALRDEKNPGKRHMSSAFEAYRRCKETFSLWRLIFRSSAGSRMRSVISSEASAGFCHSATG